MRASLIFLGSLCVLALATTTARADIGLNQTRGLDQDCFGSSSQNENFVSPTTGTVVVSINQNDNLNTWVQLFEGNTELARADAGWDETRYDDGTVTQGVTYRLHQNTDWGSCGSQTMGIWGVSIASPTQNQAITGTTTPTYSGVAPAGLTVTVFEGATALCNGTANGSGNWSCVSSSLSQGTHNVQARAPFNGYTLTASRTFSINTFTSVSITAPANGSSWVGLSAAPTTVSGTVEAGASVTVTLDGAPRCTVSGGSTGGGTWSCALPALANGNHTLIATANDGVHSATATSTFYVRTSTAVTITTPANGSTVLAFPTWSGTRQNQAALTVTVAGVTMCTIAATTPVNTVGTWSCNMGTLADGWHTVVVNAIEGTMSASASSTFRLDRGTFVTITAPPSMGTVNDPTPTITGTGEPAATVSIVIDGVTLGSALVQPGGTWSFTPAVSLGDGNHMLTANATDDVGFTASASRTFRINTGTSIAIATPTAGITLTSEPVYTGTAEPGVAITITEGASTLCATTADAVTGAWACMGPVLTEGPHVITATANDGTFTAQATRAFVMDRTTTVTITTPSGQVVVANQTATGTAENGASVVVTLDGVVLSAVTATGGNWSRALGTLADGAHTISVTATDAVGNTATATRGFTVNTGTFITITNPVMSAVLTAVPTYQGSSEPGNGVTVLIAGSTVCTTTAHATTGAWSCSGGALTDGTYTVTARGTDGTHTEETSVTFTLDRMTNVAILTPTGQTTDATPTVSGTAEANATVMLSIDGASAATLTATAGGTWTYDLPVALADGPHTASVTSTDLLGNTGTDMVAFSVNTGTSIVLVSPADGTVAAVQPVFSGTAERGVAVTVRANGTTLLCTTTADATTGEWSCVGSTLAEGTYTISATANDGVFTAVDSATLVIDQSTTVAITAPNGTVTTSTPTISGTGEPLASVAVRIDGNLVGTVVVTAGGTWSLPLVAALSDASHTALATATDVVGNMATDSHTFAVNTGTSIDLVAPVNGVSVSSVPTASGTAERGVAVAITIGAQTVCTTTADNATGAFTCALGALADGTYTVVATANDGTFTATDSATFTLDRTTTVAITSPTGTITVSPTLVSGTGEPGASVLVTLDGAPLGTVVVTVGGTFSAAIVGTLSEGAHTLGAVATDTLGNTATAAGAFTLNSGTSIDLLTPVAGVSLSVEPTYSGTGEVGATVTVERGATTLCTTTVNGAGAWSCTGPALPEGRIDVTARANDGLHTATDTSHFFLDRLTTVVITAPSGTVFTRRPTIQGTAEANAMVTLMLDGQTLTTLTATSAGTFTFALTTDLSEGSHEIHAFAQDALGNTANDTRTFIVNTGTNVDITSPLANVTMRPFTVVTGTAEANVAVTLTIAGTQVCATTATAAGAWTCNVPAQPSGVYVLTATADDGTYQAVRSITVTIDAETMVTITAPVGATGSQTPTIRGNTEPLASVVIRLDGAEIAVVTAGTDGGYLFVPTTPIAHGPHDISVTATDAVGNTASATMAFSVDTSIPAIEITAPANASVVSTLRPSIIGTATPGASVMIAIDAGAITTVVTDALGIFRLDLVSDLAMGPHTVVAATMNSVGTMAQATSTFTIDTLAPAVAIISPATGSVTADPTPTLSGTAEPNASVTLVLDGAEVFVLIAQANGTWQVELGSLLVDGTYTLTATARDTAGNMATASSTFIVDLSTEVVITQPTDGAAIGARRPTIIGTAEALAEVTISIDGVELATVTADVNGAWSFPTTSDLADGAHVVTVFAEDAVGNTATASHDFIVDPALRDSDGDGISDDDERPGDMDQDTDEDGHPNHLDPDDDGDGIPTAMERPDGMDQDTDVDGRPNHLDPDDDGDGIPTRDEAPLGEARDTDLDGDSDHLDPDDDGDSIPTIDERTGGADVDFDGDGAPDHRDPDDDDDGVPTLVERTDGAMHGHDVDGDGMPNHHDTDADGDYVDDGTDGTGDDNHNGVPNYLEASVGFAGGARCSASPASGTGSPWAALTLGLFAMLLASRRRRGAALTLVLIGATSTASAQATNIDVPTRAETTYDGFVVRSPQVPGHTRFGARLDLDYANDPLVLEAVQGSAGSEFASVVRHHARLRVLGSIGLTDRLLVFIGLPVHLVMSGDDASELAGFAPADGPGLGDPSLGARVRIYGEDADVFQLGAQLTLFIPLARAAFDAVYSGNDGFAASIDLLTRVHTSPLDILVSVGGDARKNERFGNVDVGSQLRFGVAALVPLADDRVVLSAELHASTALSDFGAREATQVGVLAGGRYKLEDGISVGGSIGTGLTRGIGSPDVHAGLMIGFDQPNPPPPPPDFDADDDGIDDATDQCPDRAEDRDGRGDEDGCPDLDDDEDGVPDAADGAPTIAEDLDGFEDHDGVPELDNDHDGILDDTDRCPSSAEDRDEIQDEDGCPEDDVDADGVSDQRDHCPFTPGVDDPRYPDCRGCPALACMRADGSIEIHQRIEFETGNDRILEESFPVLEAVISILRDNAHVARVRIEGHTDNTGNERRNLELSQRRGSSVRRWLIEHGVAAERLEAFGCGQNVALRMNNTEEGRQANRRVEFIIIDPPPPGRGHVVSDRCLAAD